MSAPSLRSRRGSRRVAALLGTDVATVRAVLNSWGPGRVRCRRCSWTARRSVPTARSASVLIPPAFGLAGVNLHTWTGWGGVSHWNAFVANLEMHGQGTFFDPAARRRGEVPDCRARALRPRARGGRPDHAAAAGAAALPALAAGAAAAARQLRPLRGEARRERCSTARRSAAPATCRRCSPSRAGTCIPPRRSASTISRRSRSPDERYRTHPLQGSVDACQGRLSTTTAASRRSAR